MLQVIVGDERPRRHLQFRASKPELGKQIAHHAKSLLVHLPDDRRNRGLLGGPCPDCLVDYLDKVFIGHLQGDHFGDIGALFVGGGLVVLECFIAVPNLVAKLKLTPEAALQVGTQIHTASEAFGKVMGMIEPRKDGPTRT